MCWLISLPDQLPLVALRLTSHHGNSDSVVRVLGVLLTSDMSIDKHAAAVSAKCFFQLRQLRRIRRSLDDNAVAARTCLCCESRGLLW